MRKITAAPIVVFLFLSLLSLILAAYTARQFLAWSALEGIRSELFMLMFMLLLYVCAIGVYRGFLRIMPLKEGDIERGSRQEFVYHVYLLFYLLLFYPLTRSLLLPVPIMRIVYLALGARLGRDSYPAGVIMDPPLTVIGNNCLIGHDAVLYSHAIEGERLSHASIVLGDNVTIGAKAIVMSGVTIGDGAIVAAGAVVLKGTRIGAGEVWGGNPARRLKLHHVSERVETDGP